MPYASEDWPAISIRREVYKQVRSTLGQALLSSPLPLHEINAVLLMSVYSNQSPSYVSIVLLNQSSRWHGTNIRAG